MSIENHPNIHAVGMAMDITNSLMHRIRGEAAEQPFGEILIMFNQEIQDFVVGISTKLDETFTKRVA